MKKKMLSLMLTGMMVVGLCACGAKKEETKADSAQVTSWSPVRLTVSGMVLP